MKLAQSLALIITGGASFVIPFALANIHVIQWTALNGTETLIACPSEDYGCDCSPGGPYGAGVVSDDGAQLTSLPGPGGHFSVQSPFCGSNSSYYFYNNGTSGRWDIHVQSGTGSLQGNCYPNTESPTSTCATSKGPGDDTVLHDQLVCYGICDK